MADGSEFDPADMQTHRLPLWARRVRALWRRATAPVREPLRRGGKRAAKLFDMRVKKPARRASKVARKLLRLLDPVIGRARTRLGLEPLQGRVDWAKGAQIGGWV